MVSFSRVVKEEIVFNDFDQSCEKAILCAMIKIIGTLSLSQSGLALTLRTENAKIASKLHKLLKNIYQPHIEFMVSKKMKLKKNNIYILKVSKAREILDDLHLMQGIGFQSIPDAHLLQGEDEKRAYLAGVFLSCGSVNNPDTSNYHLEMSVNEEEYASYIEQLMNHYELNAKMIKRRNKYVIYLKSAEKIGDFLRAIGASQSVMDFEMTRIDRSMANTVNRWNNCDIANEVKAMSASSAQIEDIAYVMDKIGLEMLDDKTRQIAILRLEHPELTLNELADEYFEVTGQTISKSGLHRRFKKIEEEALKLKQMENDKL
ncbi:MAG: DNA-binding protein WhiA [Erysipelotrichales bacterium]|nr:DNA-binding protein WhiA [Erysipelotrichales bacterium]